MSIDVTKPNAKKNGKHKKSRSLGSLYRKYFRESEPEPTIGTSVYKNR